VGDVAPDEGQVCKARVGLRDVGEGQVVATAQALDDVGGEEPSGACDEDPRRSSTSSAGR
jgi:hypothetical protein